MPNRVDIMLDPKRYGYVECPNCHGYGSSLGEASAKCTRCLGMGLIRKEDNHEMQEEDE